MLFACNYLLQDCTGKMQYDMTFSNVFCSVIVHVVYCIVQYCIVLYCIVLCVVFCSVVRCSAVRCSAVR